VKASPDGVLLLAEHKTKHKGKQQVVYLCEPAARWGSGPLFRNRYGNRWATEALGQAMRATCERAGLPVKHCYGYRHTFATDALANGVPEAHVAELLGHSGTAMLHKHCSHLGTKAAALRAALGQVRG
jgi:integrase